MTRIHCFRPNSCGVSFHVAGTSAAIDCQQKTRSLPRRSSPRIAERPKPQSSHLDASGDSLMISEVYPPVVGSRASLRNRNTNETIQVEFIEGTRQIIGTKVFCMKFQRADTGTEEFALWDAENQDSSAYEIIAYH